MHRFASPPLISIVVLSLVHCTPAQEAATSRSIASASRGLLLALAKKDETVALIDIASGKRVQTLETGSNPNEVAVSPDGRRAVVSNMGHGKRSPSNTLMLFDLPNGSNVRTIDLGAHGTPHGVIWLDERRILVTSHDTDDLVIVDAEERKVVDVIAIDEKGTHLVLLSPSKKRAYAVHAYSGTVTAIDLETKKVTDVVACGKRAEGIALSPDGTLLTVGNVGDDTVSVIETATMKVTRTLTGTASPIRTSFTPDGKFVLVSVRGAIAVFDTASWKESRRIDLAASKVEIPRPEGAPILPMNFAAHPDGKSIFVALVTSDAVAEISLDTFEVVRLHVTDALPDGIAVMPPASR